MIANADGGKLLEGIKIVDLTSVVFGPYSTQILADLGADVVKVESPGGDGFRYSGSAPKTVGMAPGFMAINRGKRAVELNLKVSEDLEVMKQLLEDADVFVLNVRGKGAERLGLDHASVKELNPEIIYAHCVGFGQEGPYADLQAYDDVIQAATGTSSLLSRVDGNPKARYLPSLIADKVAGLHAAYAILAAIIHKMRTGHGQKVEIPMFEAFASFMLVEHLGGLTFEPPIGPAGYSRQIDPDRQPFPTSDGFISIVAYTDESWTRIFRLLEKPEFLDHPDFATRKLRTRNMAQLYQEMARLTPNFTTEELAARCHAASIPAQPARDLSDVLCDPHLAATGFFRRRQHGSEGTYIETQPPVVFSDANTASTTPPPRLNEHGDDIRRSGFGTTG